MKDRLFLWDDAPGGNVEHIAEYIETHGPMTRQEVVERALTKFLSEV